MRLATLAGATIVASAAALAVVACTTKEPPPSTYFDRIIAPGLQTSCVRSNTGAGCHVADAKGDAFGNLDLSRFAGVDRRRDLLLDYGPYARPSLLVKSIAPFRLALQLWDGTSIPITTDVKHAGGAILDTTAADYETLARWIENGATENNTGIAAAQVPLDGRCSHVVPAQAGFDPTTDPSAPDFAMFGAAASVLATGCADTNCHGTPVNAFVLTCGSTPEELRWNYFAAVQELAATPEASELVRRPLATAQGGSYHEGGPIFASVSDPGYTTLLQWAGQHPPATSAGLDPAFMFFAAKVQPMLVKKGCMMAQCHSVGMFHDYRLRGGSAGSFSLTTTQRNYTLSVAQMAFESESVEASRLVRKNLYRPELVGGSPGLVHRGGALFESFGTVDRPGAPGRTAAPDRGAICDAPHYDFDGADVDTIPAYCVVREWHRRERAARKPAGLSAVVYVSRPIPAGADRPQDFDVFAGGATLHLASASLTGGAVSVAADRAVDLGACGLGAAPDVRRPAVSWDGARIAFAARASATDPFAVYTMAADGTGCAKQPDIAAHDPVGLSAPNGDMILEHDFDPTFSPPGPDGVERIVFASTRGNLDASAFDYAGPQRTPADPTKPNANLYVLEPNPGGGGAMRVRQLTWQLDMERMPSFMHDGRLIYTAEKREPGFYQLSLRRQNLDGGDYHPLFAQRGSIGYAEATSPIELADNDFATILSDATARHGAGALGVVNRSIGVDFASAQASDYPVDPTVIDPSSTSAPEAGFFLHSLRVVGRDGAYASPAPLPDGRMLVSYGPGDPATFAGDYDLYVLDPATGAKTKLLGAVGTAEVDAAAVYARVGRGLFASSVDEPNAHTQIDPGKTTAEVTVLDVPVLASLLFQNTPTGRLLEPDLTTFDIYEELPPDVTTFPTACGGNTVCDSLGPRGMVYVRRRRVGPVGIEADGSARFRIPGGLPILLRLPPDAESAARALPRWQREAMTFVQGESAHQAFPRALFGNLCGGCHGSITGRPIDAALNPDFITEASRVEASTRPPVDLAGPPSSRGAIEGPPSTP